MIRVDIALLLCDVYKQLQKDAAKTATAVRKPDKPMTTIKEEEDKEEQGEDHNNDNDHLTHSTEEAILRAGEDKMMMALTCLNDVEAKFSFDYLNSA